MNSPSQPATAVYAMPTTSIAATGWSAWQPPLPRRQRAVAANEGGLLPYPLAISPERALDGCSLDAAGIPRLKGANEERADHPMRIIRYGLAAWNAYLRNGDERYRAAVLAQARWLLAREIALPGGSGGWPIPTPRPEVYAFQPWLSAEAQSGALSLLLRAYQLTGESTYRAAATRAALTFTRDILDGGVLAPAGTEGTVFEEIAVYPAAHALSGYLHAFLGLYDYRAFALGDPVEGTLAPVLEAAHATLHTLLPHYDAGYWTRDDLLRHQLASPERHRWYATLLATLARFSGCEECAQRAQRWQRALRHPFIRPRAALTRRASALRQGARALSRRIAYPRAAAAATTPPAAPMPISVPITAYPVTGGMRAVLSGWRQAMADDWQMEFLTRHIGPKPGNQIIRSFELRHVPFGRALTSPSQFPNVWLYTWLGRRKLKRLLRKHRGYQCMLPQDGLYTAAFTAASAKRAGVRVVSVDHGNVRDIFDPVWYQDQIALLKRYRQPKRLLSRIRLSLYGPSLRFLARRAVKHTDHFLAASKDIIAVYQQHLGVPPYRATWFPFMIDVASYTRPTPTERMRVRTEHAIPEDAIVILLVNRLDPVKGMDTAIPALRELLDQLPADLVPRIRVIIAGDGPQRAQVEADIQRAGLNNICRLWGEASADEVGLLLGLSDIFLFAAKRSINSMAVLEAMAAGCAVVGTTTTQHIADYLAEGRGIAVPVSDTGRMAAALAEFVRDQPRRDACGEQSRRYVQAHHTARMLRRCLLRVTGWAPDLSHAQPRAQTPQQMAR